MKQSTLVTFVCSLLLISSHAFAQFNKNQVIAHRGAWDDAIPQNSLASLNKAIDLNCFGSEFDVHLTKDDVLVVCHDFDFYGIEIEESTYEELLQKQHPNGEKIPTAKEYILEGLKQKGKKKTKLIYELKASRVSKERTLKAAELAVKLVKELNAEKITEYIVFNYDAGKKLMELDPKAKVSYLNGDLTPEQAKEDGFFGLDYHRDVYKKNPTWIQKAHDLGLAINVWTVNSTEDMQYFLDQNVEYITTDQPGRLFELLNKK